MSAAPSDTSGNAQQFLQEVNKNPEEFLRVYNELRTQVENQIPASSLDASPPLPSFDMQAMAQAIAQALAINPPAPAIDPHRMAETVAHAVATAMQSSQPPQSPLRSEKLPDIQEYEGDTDKLDAWEQALVQRMDINHDRYPTDRAKIAYAESRLTIGKRAHNLMNSHRRNGICSLTSFEDWRQRLRKACGNPFEQEDARNYIRDLKQGTMPFDEYYNLVSQKKERSHMEDESLIDAMKHNVNYTTQQASIAWRNLDGSRPRTFAEYVQMYSEIDRELRQIKHRLPRQGAASAVTGQASRSETKKSQILAVSAPRASVATTPIVISPPAVSPSSGDPMDLSSAIAAVKGRKLTEPYVREICNKWKLCYYCKHQHPGGAKDCPNKLPRSTNLRSGIVTDLDDESSVSGGVPLNAGKA